MSQERYKSAGQVSATDFASSWRAWRDAVLSLGLFVLAVGVRWWGLPSQVASVYGDEAQIMGEARAFIDGVYTSPFIVDKLFLPGLYDWLLSFALRAAGSMDITVARGFSGVLGALSAPLLYMTAIQLGYRRGVGLVAAVVLATTCWDVHFSRLVLQNIMATTSGSVTTLCAVLAVRRMNVVWAALAGVGLAWGAYAYLSGGMIAPVVGGWLLFLLITSRRRWRRLEGADGLPDRAVSSTDGSAERLLNMNAPHQRLWAPGLLVISGALIATAVVCAAPVLNLYLSSDSGLSGHVARRYILSPENRAAFAALHPDMGTDPLRILWYQLQTTAGLFTVRADPDPIFNLPGRPLLDTLSGVLLGVGALYALWSVRRPNAMLILLWFVVPLVLGTTLTTGTVGVATIPSITRSLPAIPAMCLLIALGLEASLSGLQALITTATARRREVPAPGWWVTSWFATTVVVTAIMAFVGVSRYWEYVGSPVHGQRFHTAVREWSVLLGPRGAVLVTVVSPTGYPGEFQRLYAPRAKLCNGLWGATWMPCPPAQVVIFETDSALARRYTRATGVVTSGVRSDDGVVRFWYAEGTALPDPARAIGGRS